MSIEFWVEIVVAALLVVTAGSCAVLYFRLSLLRNAQTQMQKMLDNFSLQTEKAQASITDLRVASADIGSDLQQQIKAAQDLRDELRLMTAAGNDLADRLEVRLLGEKAPAASSAEREKPSPGSDKAQPRPHSRAQSASEKALLKALREAS